MKINESDFVYRGYRCVTTFNDMGYRCGYVAIPQGNILYGKQMTSRLPIKLDDLQDKEDNKRSPINTLMLAFDDESENSIRVCDYFNVHGGITWFEDGTTNHPVEGTNYYWIGFDCGHYRDGRDWDLVEKLWGDKESVQRRIKIEKEYDSFSCDEIRELDYVQQECKNLVDQIIELVIRLC